MSGISFSYRKNGEAMAKSVRERRLEKSRLCALLIYGARFRKLRSTLPECEAAAIVAYPDSAHYNGPRRIALWTVARLTILRINARSPRLPPTSKLSGTPVFQAEK